MPIKSNKQRTIDYRTFLKKKTVERRISRLKTWCLFSFLNMTSISWLSGWCDKSLYLTQIVFYVIWNSVTTRPINQSMTLEARLPASSPTQINVWTKLTQIFCFTMQWHILYKHRPRNVMAEQDVTPAYSGVHRLVECGSPKRWFWNQILQGVLVDEGVSSNKGENAKCVDAH